MKKTRFSTLMLFIAILGITGCGEDSKQEKAQKKAAIESISILHDLGKMAREGSSDQEIQNTALDRVAESLGNVVEGTEAELTLEEKKALKKGAGYLKDGAKGFKQEAAKALIESINK